MTKDTPPTFLFATTDDKTVPVMNSVMFYSALVKAGVPAEMHIFQHGAHGAGLAAANPELSVWPDLLAKWMRERGYMAADAGAAKYGRALRACDQFRDVRPCGEIRWAAAGIVVGRRGNWDSRMRLRR